LLFGPEDAVNFLRRIANRLLDFGAARGREGGGKHGKSQDLENGQSAILRFCIVLPLRLCAPILGTVSTARRQAHSRGPNLMN
jgi:hypothetical protein